MKTTLKNSLIVGVIMFGTLVGAGFASGKEIWFYFAQYGTISYVMIFLTALLICVCAWLFFVFGKKYNIQSVQQCNKILFKKFSFVGEIIFVFSNLLILASMFAGADSLFNIIFSDFGYRFASVFTAIICIVVVCFGLKGITKSNVVIVPLLLFVVLCILSSKLFAFDAEFCYPTNIKKSLLYSIVHSLLFVGSNMFFSGFIFAKLGGLYHKKELMIGSFIGSTFLFLALLGISIILFLSPESLGSDMPIVFLASTLNKGFGIFVLVVVWLGLLTTAIALLYTIANWLFEYIKNFVICAVFVSILALILSGIGFSYFVQIVYPCLALFGFIQIYKVIIRLKKDKKLKKHTAK